MAALPSTGAAPIRRFIYLIVSGGNDSHTLHRIDTSPLFAAGVGVRARMKTEQKYFESRVFVFYIMIPFSNMKNFQF
jgi:hypothetical protein